MNKNSFIKYLVNPLSCVYLRVTSNPNRPPLQTLKFVRKIQNRRRETI